MMIINCPICHEKIDEFLFIAHYSFIGIYRKERSVIGERIGEELHTFCPRCKRELLDNSLRSTFWKN
jgi:hypothetical protein